MARIIHKDCHVPNFGYRSDLVTVTLQIYMKKTIFTAVALVAVVTGTTFSAPTAEAAASWNGILNSDGRALVSYQNQYQYGNMYSVSYLQEYIRQLQALLEQLQRMQQYNYDYTYSNSAVDVTTRSATNVEDDRATLRGEVDFNNEDEVTVYFRWGTSASNLRYETTNIVLDEDDDETDFSATITGLNDDTTYYYRAVAEDEDGRRDYGSIMSFRTDEDGSSSSDEDYPEADTDNAENVDEDSAELHGSVDMNDFNNGDVFFVYGEDEDQIDDVADDFDSYSDVDEDGDDLQKVLVDGDLDGDKSYWLKINGLDDDTDYYFAICVGFEDEDNDDTLVCGNTEDFTTDKD